MNNTINFMKIGSFSDSFQANMAKEILQSNGISCIVTGDEFRLFNNTSTINTPIQLIINTADQKNAEELLTLYF